MRFITNKYSVLIFMLLIFGSAIFAQSKTEIVAANGQKFVIAGQDRQRGENEIVYFSPNYYKKNPTFKNGIDVYVVGGKVSVIQDRAGAVYMQNKPDPGAVSVNKDGFILSANGDARKWILANLKIGDAISIIKNEVAKNADGEIMPPASLPCFAGAYYRKVVSSYDVWTGIAGFVKLGTPQIDENRLDAENKQPLDNFSVYMGGNAGEKYEVDAGLTWGFSTDKNGKKSDKRDAFRIFWRTKTWFEPPNEERLYFYPGETVQMAILIIAPKKLRLVVSNGKDKSFQTDFDAEGFAPNIPRQFKRVNAIDQVRNEGKPAQATKAQVTGSEWLSTFLLRGAGADARQIPLDKTRFTDMRCPNNSNIVVTTTDAAKGAEKIDIYGTPKN